MSDMAQSSDSVQGEQGTKRELPTSITIPNIRGEMVFLRPARIADLEMMDKLNAYVNASGVTGKDRVAERAAVHAWVKRSDAWSRGIDASDSGVGDPESRRTIAWTLLKAPDDVDISEVSEVNESIATCIIGMIFLIDIDGWSRSARIQVILGNEYRGRGYSRDAMPRVMTYGFAEKPEGLALHRIWCAIPEKNTRSISVYQSLGFAPAGTSRDALWDNKLQKYQDLIILDSLADEYDPVNSLNAFGMHVVKGNPGVEQALMFHQHTQEIKKNMADGKPTQGSFKASKEMPQDFAGIGDRIRTDSERIAADDVDAENTWPYNSAERNNSKKAWWRNLGRDRVEGKDKSKTRRKHED